MRTKTNRPKIGLYGGSFNPIHFGHMEVMNEVLDRNIVDELWVMPCRNHMFNKKLASIEDRMAMLTQVTSGMDGVRIEDLEVRYDTLGRTATSLKKLRKINPDKEFYFIAGSDAVNDIDRWYDAKYIKKTTPFIVVNRPGYILNKNLDIELKAVLDDVSPISSTDIRERVFCGLSLKGLVPKCIEEYISKNGLYKPIKSDEHYVNPASTTDLIVPINDGLLFVKRKYEPFKGYWAFPGGFLNNGKESLEETGVRELFEETSLETTVDDLELLGVYSKPDRDPRGHVIAHTFVVKKFSGTPYANDDALEVQVFKNKPDKLAFDHPQMYDDYMRRVKR